MPRTAGYLQDLHRALSSAFPTRSALSRMVRFELDENLDALAAPSNLADTIFELIQWAEAHGRLADLFEGARRANPDNPMLLQLRASALTAGAQPAIAQPSSGGTPPGDAPSGVEHYEELAALLPAQFGEVIFRLGVPEHHLPGPIAPQAQRAQALVHLLRQEQGGLDRLAAAIEKAGGARIPRPGQKPR